jgi:hypothetical protein
MRSGACRAAPRDKQSLAALGQLRAAARENDRPGTSPSRSIITNEVGVADRDVGSTSIMAPADQTWGDRVAGIFDPFDNRWWIGTHLHDFT